MTLGNPRPLVALHGETNRVGTGQPAGVFWRIAPVALGFLAVVALILAGCQQDEIKRYETLSFFFDGVPPPEGYDKPVPQEPLIGPWGVMVDPESEMGREMLAKREVDPNWQVTEEPEEVFFYHTPYRNRECFGCHDQDQGYTPPATGAQLCNKCHASYTEFEVDDWVHGPVAVGLCGWCHGAHKAEYPSLVKDSQPSICMTCHDQSFIEQDEFHAGLEDKRCTACHDPHASGNRLLLADSRTYERRPSTLALLPSPHAGWSKDSCSNCHLPEQSNALTEDVDTTCISCHDNYNSAPEDGSVLHEAVMQGKCTACHMPHRSPMPNLIRPDAERKCYQCHTPEEVRTENHPNVTRVDCLICHTGHSSARPSLLKPDITLRNRPLKPGGAP